MFQISVRKPAKNCIRLPGFLDTWIFQNVELFMKALINSQFGYCPLVWMCHIRTLNNRINRIQEKTLRIVYNDHISTFMELLKRDSSVTIYNRNIQLLAIEI